MFVNKIHWKRVVQWFAFDSKILVIAEQENMHWITDKLVNKWFIATYNLYKLLKIGRMTNHSTTKLFQFFVRFGQQTAKKKGKKITKIQAKNIN